MGRKNRNPRKRRKRMTPCARCGKRVLMGPRMDAHWRKHMRDEGSE